ncbi:hypothetical protein CF319_g3574 [Tilletia indica]|nr:hypothetical protein CF319_g3574 [Tilletia indica]
MTVFCVPSERSDTSSCGLNTLFTAYLPTALVILYIFATLIPAKWRRSAVGKAFDQFVTPEEAYEIARTEREKEPEAFVYQAGRTAVDIDPQENGPAANEQARHVAKGKGRAAETTNASNGSGSTYQDQPSERTPLLGSSGAKTSGLKVRQRTRHSVSTLTLCLLFALQAGAWCVLLAFHLGRQPHASPSRVTDGTGLTSGLVLLTWIYAFTRIAIKPQQTPPYDLFALLWLHIAGAAVTLYGLVSDIQNGDVQTDAVRLALILESANLVVCAIAQTVIFAMPIAIDVNDNSDSSEERCSLWAWTTFNWMNPLIAVALRGSIDKKDLWIMPLTCRAAVLYRKFESVRGSSLLRRLYLANSSDFLKDGLLTFISALLGYGKPFFIRQILRSIQLTAAGTPDVHRQTAYLYAFLVLLVSFIASESDVNHLYLGRRMSVRVKAELIAAIYAKALRRKDSSGLVQASKSAGAGSSSTGTDKNEAAKNDNKQQKNSGTTPDDGAADVGKIVSIMAVDAQRVGDACQGFYQIWTAPVQLVAASVFLYLLLGWSAFVGCIAFVIFSPLQGRLMKYYLANLKRVNGARDKRLTSLNELIGNLKMIRLCGWIPRWTERVLEQRKEELRYIRYSKVMMAVVGATFEMVPISVSVLSFSCYVLIAHRDLDTATAFTALALFNMLGGPLSFLPIMLTNLAETYTSLQRIEAFLEEEDVPERVQTTLIHPSTPFDERLGCEKASFRWRLVAKKREPSGTESKSRDNRSFVSRLVSRFRRPKKTAENARTTTNSDAEGGTEDEQKPFELNDITLSCPVGRLTLLCGSTGAGKSSLLSALLGEMDLTEGKVYLPKQPHWKDPTNGLCGRIAYCSQTPWLCSQSIKDNILFGSPYEKDRYEEVLDSCALRPDLKVLIDGDKTEIGEKGTTLSGGQRARVALARVLYSRTKTVLMDDVLSAVDAHTASHLVENVLLGPLLRDRTTLLVSHNVTLVMPAAAWVARIANGRIIAQGTPSEIRASGELGDLLQEAEKQEEIAAEIIAAEEATPAGVEKIDDAAVPAPAIPNKPKQLISEETRARGAVKWGVYATFLRAYGVLAAIIVVLIALSVKVLDAGSSLWLAKWTSSYDRPRPSPSTHMLFNIPTTESVIHTSFYALDGSKSLFPNLHANASKYLRTKDLPSPSDNVLPWISIYAAILFGGVLLKVILSFVNFYSQLRASKNLFERMLRTIVRASARWVDTTPLGRILNRFSKDIEVLDGSLASNLRTFFMTGIDIVGAIAIITYTVPPFLLPAIVILVVHYWIARGYMSAGRDLRRLESTLRSPIFSAFGELLQGIAVVRAFGVESRYMAVLCNRVDESLSAHFYQWMGNRWLLLRFENLGGLTIFITCVLALGNAIPVGLAGVAIAQSLSLTQYVYWMCRFATAMEQDLSSVERVSEYLPPHIPSEKAITEDTKPVPAYWPSNSQGISVDGLEFKYSEDLDPVLHKISFHVQPGERIAVVGRTGSGKSSLALALMRFNEYSAGTIHIDGVDISKIDLDVLRSRLTLIPQDPVMFKGTVRENLDPFGEYDDATLIQTLQRCQLRILDTPTPKDSKVPSASASRAASVKDGLVGGGAAGPKASSESDELTLSPESARLTLDSGATLSQGQRQLLAMARSILRGSRVCIMDESTASLDFETDRLIQTMIRQEFEGSILITIAHRLSTVIDYDRCLVMDQGHIKEFDTPYALLQNRSGAFYSMIARSGEAEKLHAAAAEAHSRKVAAATA